MADYYLYPDSTVSGGATWTPTGAATIHAATDDLVGAPDDDATYAQGSQSSWDYAYLGMAPMVDPIEILSVTAFIRYNNAGGGSAQEVDFGVRIGGVNYLNGSIGVVSATYADASKLYTLNPATSGVWTKTALDDVQFVIGTQDAGGKPIDSVRITQAYLHVVYQPLGDGLIPARGILSHRLRRYRDPVPRIAVTSRLDLADNELVDNVSVTHFELPPILPPVTEDGDPYGIEPWERHLFMVAEEEIDPNNRTITHVLHDQRPFLCMFWDTAESRTSISPIEDGVGRLTSGGETEFLRASKAWIPDPASILVTEIGNNQKPIAQHGLLMESAATNYLVHSSAKLGAASLGGGAVVAAGTGVNGSALTAAASPGQPLFHPDASDYGYFFVAGNPHAADLSATWPATASLSGGADVRFSIDYVTSGATLTANALKWRLTRGVDGFYWNDATPAWQAGAVANDLAAITTRDRAFSNRIDVGAGATTLTLMLYFASGGTASRNAMVYHVQMEDNDWATSRVVTDTAIATRAVESHSVENVSGKRAILPTQGTLLMEFIPEWSAADMNARGGIAHFFSMVYDASNWIILGYSATTLLLTIRAAGVSTVTSVAWSPVRAVTYRLAGRWVSSAGELGMTPRSQSVFVDGVKGTDVVRAADPTETSVDMFIGSAAAGATSANGNCRRIASLQIALTDDEIAGFRP